MRSIQAVVSAALTESGVEDAERIARRTVKRLAAHRAIVVTWLISQGTLRFVGYMSASGRRIREHPITRDDRHVYVIQGPDGAP